MIGEKITVITHTSDRYTGILIDLDASIFLRPKWLKLQRRDGTIVLIHTEAVTAIIYEETRRNKSTRLNTTK